MVSSVAIDRGAIQRAEDHTAHPWAPWLGHPDRVLAGPALWTPHSMLYGTAAHGTPLTGASFLE